MNYENTTLIIGGQSGIGHEVARVFKVNKIKYLTLSRRKSKKKNHFQFDINNKNDHKLNFGKIKNLIFCQRCRTTDPILEYQTMIINPIKFINAQKKNFIKGASVIFIGSNAYKFVYKEQNAFYHASRGAIFSLTKYLSYNLGILNIRVNCVLPSTLLKKENKKFFSEKKNRKNLENIIPNNKMTSSNNIATLCLFLCSENSKGINGEIINVDNGLTSVSQETTAMDILG